MEECVRCTVEALALSKIYWDEYRRHRGSRATLDLLNVIGELKHAETHIIDASREIHDMIRRVRMKIEECISRETCPVDFEEKINKILLKLTSKECGETCPATITMLNHRQETSASRLDEETGGANTPETLQSRNPTWTALLLTSLLIIVLVAGGLGEHA